MSAAATDSVARVLSTVDYLRVTLGPERPSEREWLACSTLVADPDALAGLARSTAPGRGTDRDDVALSLFVQGYAFRIASIAVGCWLLDGIVLDLAPEGASIALGRDRPNAVHLDEAREFEGTREVDGAGALAGLHASVVDGHLAKLVANAHDACRVGEALLWSNVGAGFASSFGAFMGPLPERRAEIRDRFEEFLAAARPELAGSGRVAHVGPLWAWERSACCLWYKTESGFQCEDCSLWSEDDRQVRYDRILAGLDG